MADTLSAWLTRSWVRLAAEFFELFSGISDRHPSIENKPNLFAIAALWQGAQVKLMSAVSNSSLDVYIQILVLIGFLENSAGDASLGGTILALA
jgi:hypothetical protein